MKTKYLILLSLTGFIISIDQLTKQVIVKLTESSEYHQTLIPGILEVVLSKNSGIGFGFVQRMPVTELDELFFIGIPVFALILIVLIFIKLRDNQMMTSVALTTILGGAIGNLIDRIHYGYVIDYLKLNLGVWQGLPPFNVADISIMMGVLIMFLHTLHIDFSSRGSNKMKS